MNQAGRGKLFYPFGSLSLLPVPPPALEASSKATIDPRRLERPVSSLQGVGKSIRARLEGLGIVTVRDLLMHLPFRHEPPSRITSVASLCVGEEVTLRARVISCAVRETARRRVRVLDALISDDSGSVVATWYNQAYLEAPFR
jgi:ATP-dependent DNA helicase RecG